MTDETQPADDSPVASFKRPDLEPVEPVVGIHPDACRQLELREFETRVLRYQASLFAFLGRMGFEQALVEELAQETFFKAWRSRHRYQPEKGRYSTWLFAIARNLAIDALGKRHRLLESADEHLVAVATDGSRASDALEQEQRTARITRALDQLSDSDRAMLSLAYVEQVSAAEAALLAGCKPQAYRTRLSRARARLRTELEKHIE